MNVRPLRPFTPDPRYDRLILLRRSDPAAAALLLTPRVRIGLGMYEAQQKAAQDAGTHEEEAR